MGVLPHPTLVFNLHYMLIQLAQCDFRGKYYVYRHDNLLLLSYLTKKGDLIKNTGNPGKTGELSSLYRTPNTLRLAAQRSNHGSNVDQSIDNANTLRTAAQRSNQGSNFNQSIHLTSPPVAELIYLESTVECR